MFFTTHFSVELELKNCQESDKNFMTQISSAKSSVLARYAGFDEKMNKIAFEALARKGKTSLNLFRQGPAQRKNVRAAAEVL